MKYQIGDLIEVKNDYYALPGNKQLKKGTYVISGFRKSFTSRDEMVYDIKSTRKNSSYVWSFFQNWVENDNNVQLKNK